MTITADLAGRVIAGAHHGRLLLTIDEVRQMLENVHPDTSVTVNGHPVKVCDLPVIVMDNLDPHPNLHLDDETARFDAWHAQLAASWADDLIDADDVERLWHQPPG